MKRFSIQWFVFLVCLVCIVCTGDVSAQNTLPEKHTSAALSHLNPSLLKAKTVQVLVTSEDYMMAGPDGKLHTLAPYPQTFRVSVSRPDKFRVEELVPVNLYVTDGQTQYRYHYQHDGEKEAIKQFSGATLFGTAWTDALLKEPTAFVKAQATGEEIVDDRRMQTYSTNSSVDGYSTKIYIEKATHLPYRVSGLHKTSKGVIQETSRLEFRSWVFDDPIPAAYFAWTPPASAQEILHPTPVLVPLAVGSQAPDFVVYAPDGHAIHLSDYRGKVVVLDFWATWCGPCQQELPLTAVLAKKYADKNVVFLGICTSDKKEAFLKWLPKHPEYSAMQFVYDPAQGEKSVEFSLYHVNGLPAQYIVSADGKVAAADVGAKVDREAHYETYSKFVQALSAALDADIAKLVTP